MEINNDTKKFAEELIKELIEKRIIKSKNDIDEEMIDRIIEAIRKDIKNKSVGD